MSTNLGGVGSAKRSIESGELLSDVSGILLLLISAKFSLETHVAGRSHVDSLEKCICGIQRQYNLSERDLREEIVRKATSFDATLRLLEYVAGEVRSRLNDREMAAELQRCVDRLAKVQTFSRAPCDIMRPFTRRNALPFQ